MRREYFLIAGCEIGVWCFYFTFRVYLKCNHRDDEYVSIFHIFLGPNFVGGGCCGSGDRVDLLSVRRFNNACVVAYLDKTLNSEFPQMHPSKCRCE